MVQTNRNMANDKSKMAPEDFSEGRVLEIVGMNSADLLQPEEMEEVLYRILHDRSLQDHVRGCDDHIAVARIMGPPKKMMSVATALRVMDTVERVGWIWEYPRMSFQKFCVAYTFCPWLLKGDGRFMIGLCYFHRPMGGGPKNWTHLHHFVHTEPSFSIPSPSLSTEEGTSSGGGGASSSSAYEEIFGKGALKRVDTET